jgi:hypothetical protein
MELERNGNEWGMENGKYEEWLPRGFDDGAFLDVFTSFGACLFWSLPLPCAFACRWPIVEW